MTYQAALWSAIIGEAEKFGCRITKAKRKKYMKLVTNWQRDTK